MGPAASQGLSGPLEEEEEGPSGEAVAVEDKRPAGKEGTRIRDGHAGRFFEVRAPETRKGLLNEEGQINLQA